MAALWPSLPTTETIHLGGQALGHWMGVAEGHPVTSDASYSRVRALSIGSVRPRGPFEKGRAWRSLSRKDPCSLRGHVAQQSPCLTAIVQPCESGAQEPTLQSLRTLSLWGWRVHSMHLNWPIFHTRGSRFTRVSEDTALGCVVDAASGRPCPPAMGHQ